MNNEFPKDIQSLINAYEFLVRGIETKAKESEDRSYGGIIRAEVMKETVFVVAKIFKVY